MVTDRLNDLQILMQQLQAAIVAHDVIAIETTSDSLRACLDLWQRELVESAQIKAELVCQVNAQARQTLGLVSKSRRTVRALLNAYGCIQDPAKFVPRERY